MCFQGAIEVRGTNAQPPYWLGFAREPVSSKACSGEGSLFWPAPPLEMFKVDNRVQNLSHLMYSCR